METLDTPIIFGNVSIHPPVFLAPMAGITHSAFRRLVADFGGYGALFTEMLSGTGLYNENLQRSPFTRRRPAEGPVFYQIRLSGDEDFARIIQRLSEYGVFGIDINCGCPAPEIRKMGAGIELFDDGPRLMRTLQEVRRLWSGPLTVKCRLGKPGDHWRSVFEDRMHRFEESGVNAVIVHPRFSDEKLKRKARWELFPWICSLTRLPIIANGDIARGDTIDVLGERGCKGVMIGRMAVVKPWFFSEHSGRFMSVDYCEVWTRLFDYISADFRPEQAIGRIKEFTAYFARNFVTGHQMFKLVQGAVDLQTIRSRAVAFLSAVPEVVRQPSVLGI